MISQKDIDRFCSKLIKTSTDCWEYSGAKDADGYGMFWFQGKTKGAHQFSARYLGNMILQPGNHVCHSCDNPPCCNPNHLFVGSSQMNTADRQAKGRTVKGSQVGTSVYSEDIIKKIKDAYKTRTHYRGIIKDLSQEFNVSYGVVWTCCRNQGWRHV